MARWTDYGWFPPSRPRKAEGGIKARSKRGFGQQWWAKRWIAALEALNLGGRLSRGRSYARSGQVLSIEIDKQRVDATVQGSRPTPYCVSIGVTAVSRSDWSKLTRVLSGSPLHVAQLIAGEMPEDIETLFGNAGITLFPARASELRTECSCPDWSNPYKHIAAVYYLLGEEFDRDPFLIFKLRGIAREELASIVGSAAPPKRGHSKPMAPPEDTPRFTVGATAPENFWEGSAPEGDLFGLVEPPPRSAPILQRLGAFPFWRGETGFLESLEPIYPAAAAIATAAFVGEQRRAVETSVPHTPARVRSKGKRIQPSEVPE
ncbi:MAG: hypothetical protein ABI837_10630 [Acidobacteriota bacterium]